MPWKCLVKLRLTCPWEVDRAHAAGADVVLIKPVTPESLLREIDRLLVAAPESQAPKTTRSATPRSLNKAYRRVTTTTPPRQPPDDLWCPSCTGCCATNTASSVA
jgi:hypothetical protein